MKLMATLFSSSTTKREDKAGKKSRRRSMSRSEAPSFGSSSSSGSDDSLCKAAAAPQTPRSVIFGRDTSCIDVEYALASPPAAGLFCVFDRDGGGKFTKQELVAVLQRLGRSDPPTKDEVTMMLAEVDRDGDGCISLDDFDALGPRSGEEELKDAFRVFDVNGDGKISAEELLEVFRELGDDGCSMDDCRRMIGGVDSNGDGFVGFDDFVRMMSDRRCR